MAPFILIVALLCGCVFSFNVDIASKLIHRSDQPNSMFGFSVALHKDNGVGKLLIGAPKFSTEQRKFGIENPGAVLSCSTEKKDECNYVPFDKQGNNYHPLGGQIDEKSGQWFGATVKSSGEDGVVLACAPRYHWFTENLERREPVGTCYLGRNSLTDFTEFSFCRTGKWGYHRQGSCQFGFDAAISKDGQKFFVGAPGAFYWQGQVHSQDLGSATSYYRTGESPMWHDNEYLSYSVASGDFSGDGIPDVAVGVPHGLNHTGKISIYTHDMRNLLNITGQQLGSYYGYCLAVTDFNNDGRDDIIVGAPMYTDYEDREMKLEVGRVHILLQNSLYGFDQRILLTGKVSKGRFGLSVAAIGDINKDGFQDIAVGAPYGGPDGNGAVFIYHGFYHRSGDHKDLEKELPAQIIYSADISPRIATFGWSLSGGMDMDNNKYPDILVGAYLSNSAVMLKTRPIVNLVNHTLQFISEGRAINLDQNTCTTNSGQPVPCVDLKLCVTYSGVGVGDTTDFIVDYSLDSKISEPRIFFVDNNSKKMTETVRLRKDSAVCSSKKVFIMKSLRDKLSPLTAEASFSLPPAPAFSRQRRNAPLYPIMNQRQTLSITDEISIMKNCGTDDVCVPDLKITVEGPHNFTLGTPEMLNMSVSVINEGEDAFEAAVFFAVPKGVLYNKFVTKESNLMTCSPRYNDGQQIVVCDIGNPMPTDKEVVFEILFQQLGSIEKPNFDFYIEANSTNKEADLGAEDNKVYLDIEVIVDMELILYGTSEPETLDYNISHYSEESIRHEEDFGPEIIHRYSITNQGPTEVVEVQIVILWPMQTSAGEDLLYLLEKPFTGGSVTCEDMNNLNPYNLQLYSRADTYKRLRVLSNNEEALASTAEGSGEEGGYSSSSSTYQSGGSTSYQSGGSSYHSSGSSGYQGGSSGYQGGSSGYQGGSSGYQGGSSGYQGGSSGYQSGSSGYQGGSSGSQSGSSGSYSGGYDYSYSSGSTSGGAYNRSYSYSSSSGGYKRGESAGENSIRTRRDTDGDRLDWETETSNCGDNKCVAVRCTAGPLSDGDDINIYLRSRVKLQTLEQFTANDLKISSKMVARINRLPKIVNPDFLEVRSHEVSTLVSPAHSFDSPPPVPWWIIVLAILVGIIILLFIILILWKCEYFKRNRPNQHSDEAAQPLRSNGRHNGVIVPRTNGRSNGNSGGHYHHRNGAHPPTLYPGDERL